MKRPFLYNAYIVLICLPAVTIGLTFPISIHAEETPGSEAASDDAAPALETETTPVDTPPIMDADTRSTEDAAPAQSTTEAMERFREIGGQWKELMIKMKTLQIEYSEASSERRAIITQEWNTLLTQGDKLRAEYLAAAEPVYIETKGKESALTVLFLIRLAGHVDGKILRRTQDDNYEEAARIARLMYDAGCTNKRFYSLAALAAYAVNDYDLAQMCLEKGRKDDGLTPAAKLLLITLAYHRQAWAEEQQIRKAETDDNLPHVLLKTSKGDIELELFENEAPNTVANFISLIDQEYYNGLTFHRVLPGFMAQGGCNKGDGTGGPGYYIPCETGVPGARKHFRGSLSMAHAGSNTGGAQFFLTFVPTPQLDGLHTVFGRIVKGFDVLSKIQRRNPESEDPPTPDRIITAEVLSRRDHPYVPKTLPSPRR